MATFTYESDGEETTVEVPDAAVQKAGFLAKSDIKDTYVSKEYHEGEIDRVSKRFKGAARDEIRDELKQDDAFLESILAERGKGKDIDLDAAKKDWASNDLDPLKEELTKVKTQLKEAAIREAAAKYFDERFIDNPFSSVESRYGDQFEYDSERGYVVQKNGDGYRQSSDPKEGRPYADPNEFFGKLAQDPQFKDYAKPEERLKGGDGARINGEPGGKETGKKNYWKMSDMDRVAYSKEHGTEALMKLMETSEKE